ncbi:hypothetical protein Are01nite_29440 [Actinoplanes regularis]|nr:hypothetical protein Are01nite_29440 [Actinoplanes regularis]
MNLDSATPVRGPDAQEGLLGAADSLPEQRPAFDVRVLYRGKASRRGEERKRHCDQCMMMMGIPIWENALEDLPVVRMARAGTLPGGRTELSRDCW